MNSTITGEWIDDTDDNNYDGDSDIPSRGRPNLVPCSLPSFGASARLVPRVTKTRGAVSSAAPSSGSNKKNRPSDASSTKPILYATSSPSNDLLPNGIKALPGRKFTGDELTTYGDAIKKKKTGMIRISGFNTNSIKLDEIR